MEQRDHSNDIQLSVLEKDGDALMQALDRGHMVAILAENELMFVFSEGRRYLCYIHALDAEEGRAKAFPRDEEHRAVIRHMAQLGDLFFEAQFKPGMERMGVMFAAEQGIIRYLDVTGQLPVEDVDFMAPYEAKQESEEEA